MPSNAVDRVSKFLKDDDPTLLYYVLSNMELTLLYDKIREMRQYGETINTEKGTEVQILADELKGKLSHYLNDEVISKILNKQPFDPKTLIQFKEDFTILAHSKDTQMNEHREIWKPIVANIILALTGVGLLALVGNIIIQIARSATDKQAISFNNLFFFAKTHSESLIKNIDEINSGIQLNKNDGLYS
jgi:hypothetical protein